MAQQQIPPSAEGSTPTNGDGSQQTGGATASQQAPPSSAASAAPTSAPTPPVAPPAMRASIYPDTLLHPFVVSAAQVISEELHQECWLFITGNVGIEPIIYEAFADQKDKLPNSPIALIIDSRGGVGETAYRIARLLKRRCGGFTAVIPRKAKSAATLLSLGADRIILGDEADLGPLDAQFHDYDEEEQQVSALDTVQAVEALEDSAVEVGMKMLRYLQANTGKRYSLLIEPSLRFAAEITKPLFEKIDAVRYTRQSRILREAQDYAERLLRYKFSEQEAGILARHLVQKYPAHGFIIDFEEAKRVGIKNERIPNQFIGLHVEKPINARLTQALDLLRMRLASDENTTALGQIIPMPSAPTSNPV